ncbi:uncharacterized protein L201_000497 [Kwoniella dendrophila CBS 6074]|uniref:Uncharacterized protein n=1 Tax=Kwoniella dendrophila CBS 6074 TaxID=1295534 RepID=A0AAX4JJR1_9TREE
MATIVDDSNSNLFWSGTSWKTEHSDDPLTGKYFNSGLYGIQLDNGAIQYFSGYSSEGQFQATLFATKELIKGKHTLKISNENQNNQDTYPDYVWFDIDSIAVTGTLINAVSSEANISSSSSSSSSILPSSDTSTSTDSDVVNGQYSATISSPSIVSTSSEIPNTTVQPLTTTTPPNSPPLLSSSAIQPSSAAEDGNKSHDRRQVDRCWNCHMFTSSSLQSTLSRDTNANILMNVLLKHRVITLAISIPVIVVSSGVIIVFLGLFYLKRRKRKYEQRYQGRYHSYMVEPQSSWR